MTSSRRTSPAPAGVLERWARFSYRHRWQVVGAWAVGLVAITVASFMFGGQYSSAFKVPGSDSMKASNLLDARFPARSGDSADLVFEAPGGANSAEARGRIEAVIAQVKQIDGVVAADSPFSDPRFISADGTIARTDVDWSTKAGDVNAKSFHQFLRSSMTRTATGFA